MDYQSGRGIAIQPIDPKHRPGKVTDFHERHFSNQRTKQFVDSTSVPLGGDNIRSSSLSKKENKSIPNVTMLNRGDQMRGPREAEAVSPGAQKIGERVPLAQPRKIPNLHEPATRTSISMGSDIGGGTDKMNSSYLYQIKEENQLQNY